MDYKLLRKYAVEQKAERGFDYLFQKESIDTRAALPYVVWSQKDFLIQSIKFTVAKISREKGFSAAIILLLCVYYVLDVNPLHKCSVIINHLFVDVISDETQVL